jgi:hypothetical protein
MRELDSIYKHAHGGPVRRQADLFNFGGNSLEVPMVRLRVGVKECQGVF